MWASKRITSSSDFFMPRKFGKLMMTMFAFGTGTHSDQAVSVASKSFTNGLSGIWYQWLWLPLTPFYWLIAPVFRRFRAVTTSNVFEARFNPSVAMLYALIGITTLMVNIGVMLKGSGEVISACTGGALSANLAIAVMTVIFVVYGVAGGLSAAIVTDFLQGLLTIVFSVMLLPLILGEVGGWGAVREGLKDTDMLSLVAPGEITLFYVIIMAFNGLFSIVAQPHTMGNCAAGKTELEGRLGFMSGTFIKRLCTVLWSLTGVAAVVYFTERAVEPDKVFGTVAGELLPALMPGLLGIFLAAVLASVMSSCDVFMVSSSALFTEDFYKRLVKDKPKDHYLLVGRVTAVAVVIGGIAFAYSLPGVVEGLEIFWKVTAMMGIAFWMGLFWRRASVAGAWTASLVAIGIFFLNYASFFIAFVGDLPFSDSLRFIIIKEKTGPEIYLPWQMIFYLSGGILAGVVVSLLTRPVDEEKLEHFFALTRTPIQPGEHVERPCTLPEGAVVPVRRNLIPSRQFEVPVPSVVSMAGFIVGWCIVAAIIYAVYLIAGG